MPKWIAIPAYCNDFHSWYLASDVAVIDMPLIDVIDAAKEDLDAIDPPDADAAAK
jgi:hypothetical protein